MTETATCYILCSCGLKHRLFPGLEAPVYWCGDNLKELQVGDDVEVEEPEEEFLLCQ